jgi:hypothetical protein
MVSEKVVRFIAGIIALSWAGLHLFVGYQVAVAASHVVGHAALILAIITEYFGFNAALYIFAAYEIITFTRRLLLPFFLLFLWNTILLIVTRLTALPIIGGPLPVIPPVYPALIFDGILLITTSNLLVRTSVEQ